MGSLSLIEMMRVLAWRNGDRISVMSVQTAQDPAAAFQSVLAALTHFLGSPVLGAVVRAGIPDRLDAGPMAAAELARVTGLHPLSTTRVLRMLASFGVFWEVEPGVFANTEASKLLRNRPGGLRNLVWNNTTDEHLRAVAGLGHSVRTGESTFAHVTGQSFWDYLRADPERAAACNAMFAELRGGEQLAIADAMDWPTTATVADIGGGNGSLLATILETRPNMRGVLLDIPDGLRQADEHLRSRGVRNRCELVAQSFFDPVEFTADVWLFSQVLHDWSDADCRMILNNCRGRLRPGDRALVVEIITVPCRPDIQNGLTDMLMLMLFGEARQRTAQEYDQLFSQCDLALSRVIPTASPYSVVEAVPITHR